MITTQDTARWARTMFPNDTILFYGPDQTYGLYKKSGHQVMHFCVPTTEARKPSGRTTVARKVYTDLLHACGLHAISPQQLCAGINALSPQVEIYQANRTRRFRRLLVSVCELG